MEWVGIREVYGLTATFPATGNILARDTLYGGRGGMPVKCGDKLPCSSGQWLFLTSSCLSCATITGSGHRSVSN